MGLYDLSHWGPILASLDDLEDRLTSVERAGQHRLVAEEAALHQMRSVRRVLDELRAQVRALGEDHARLRLHAAISAPVRQTVHRGLD